MRIKLVANRRQQKKKKRVSAHVSTAFLRPPSFSRLGVDVDQRESQTHQLGSLSGKTMDGPKTLSDFQRGNVIGCHLCNKTVREISVQLNIPQSTVSDVIKKWKESEKTNSAKKQKDT